MTCDTRTFMVWVDVGFLRVCDSLTVGRMQTDTGSFDL